MPPTVDEARRRLRATLAVAAPDLTLDAAAVRRIPGPYPGFEYGLRLGQANALLFLPLEDLDGDGWETRLAERLRQARAYLEAFPLARVRR